MNVANLYLLCMVYVGVLLAVGGQPVYAGTPKTSSAKASSSKPESLQLFFRPGKGLVVKAPNNYFVLRTRLRAQFLYAVSADNTEESEPENSFQIRRARLAFTGSFFGKHNKFKAEIAISPRDLSLSDDGLQRSPLLDWFVTFDYLRDLTVRLGQFKVMYSRERVVSSGNLTLVDRSIVNREFNVDRDLGIEVGSKDFLGLGYLRYTLGVYMGEGHSSFAASNFGLMYIARLEVTPLGRFKDDYTEGDHRYHSTPKLSIGVAYAFLDEGKGNRGILGRAPADGGTTDTHNFNADFVFKWQGLGLIGCFMWRKGIRSPGQNKNPQGQDITPELPRDGMGVYGQISYLFRPPVTLQLAARVSHIRPIGTAETTSLVESNAAGGAVSYYFAKHPFKLQLDYFYLWGTNNPNGEHRVRLQLQASL